MRLGACHRAIRALGLDVTAPRLAPAQTWAELAASAAVDSDRQRELELATDTDEAAAAAGGRR